MLEPIVTFFDKLIENFSWRRLIFLLVLLGLSGGAAWIYETYTQQFRLARIEKQISLVEKLAALESNKALATQPHLKQAYTNLQQQLSSTMNESGDQYELLPWGKKMLATAVAWSIFALFILLIPESYSTAKNAPGAVFFGMLAVAAPFIALSAAVPTFSTPWLNYTLYPIGHLVVLTIAILAWSNRQRRRHQASLRQS